MSSELWSFTIEAGYEIPSYLFTAPDASAYIFDFLADPLYHTFDGPGVSHGQVSNWTATCAVTSNVLLGYGSFLGCLLYPNVTRGVRDGSLPANLTDFGFPTSNNTADPSRDLRSLYPTCLSAYCASQPACAAASACDVGNLLTNGYELSAQGIGTCWETLCSSKLQVLDGDIAGMGILLSYLMQSILALLGIFTLAVLACLVHWNKRRAASHQNGSDHTKRYQLKIEQAKRQWEIVHATLAEFHRAQCFLAIALQIASFVTIFAEIDSTNYADLNFLLLVSLDGLIPVVLVLYTLMTFGKKSWYMISLSFISVALASASGGYIVRHLILIDGAVTVQGGDWPASCDSIGPESICGGIGPNTAAFNDDSTAFLAVMIIFDIVMGLLIVWKVLTDSTTMWSTVTGRMARLLDRRSKTARTESGFTSYEYQLGRIERSIAIVFHLVVLLSMLGCLVLEFWYFEQIFGSPWVDFESWGFGQIVGITTWAGVLTEIAYLEYNGLDEGFDWRFPTWLHVRESTNEQSVAKYSPFADKNLNNSKSAEASVFDTSPGFSKTFNLDARSPSGFSDSPLISTRSETGVASLIR